jgi:endoglucanase
MAVIAAGLATAIAGSLVAACSDGADQESSPGDEDGQVTSSTTGDEGAIDRESTARAAARHFLDTYVGPDGRVERHDRGGDTVSEGQAYAVLLAAAIGDDETVDRVWSWTAANLQRPDGLLSWHFADGAVVDRESAPDAEVDAIRGLLLASDGPDDERARAAWQMADALAAQVVVSSPWEGMLLAPGEWAIDRQVSNPSYFSPRTVDVLATRSPEPWAGVMVGSRAELLGLTDGGRLLPPDWSTWEGATPVPTGGPGLDGSPRYAWDAARVPVRLAESCDPSDRALAAAWSSTLQDEPARIVRDLDGEPSADDTHPLALVGAAASAHAAGDTESRDELLDEAEALDRQRPTYYGSAWVALGRILLQTDLAGTC